MATLANLTVALRYRSSGTKRVAKQHDALMDKIDSSQSRLTKFATKMQASWSRIAKGMRSSLGASIQRTSMLALAFFTLLPTLAVAAAGAIVLAMGGAFAAIGTAALLTNNKLRKSFEKTGKRIVDSIKAAAQPLVPVIEHALAAAERVVAGFAPVFKRFFQAVQGPLIKFIDRLAAAFMELKPVIPAIARAFTRLMEALGPKLPVIFNRLADGIIAVANAVAKNPQAFVNFVMGIARLTKWMFQLVGLITRYPKLFMALAASLVVAGMAAMIASGMMVPLLLGILALAAAAILVWATIKWVVPALIKAFTWLKEGILNAAGIVADWFKGPFVGAFKTAGAKIKQGWETFRNWWTGPFKNAFVNAGKAIAGFFTGPFVGAFQDAWNAITRGWNAFKSFFTRAIPNAVRNAASAVARMASRFYSAGIDLIMGLVNGVRAAAWRLVQAALAAVKDAVATVKGWLGIGSPSRLFMGFGQDMIEGMARGIESRQRRLQQSLRHTLANVATPAIGASVGIDVAGIQRAVGGLDQRIVIEVAPADVNLSSQVIVDNKTLARAVEQGQIKLEARR